MIACHLLRRAIRPALFIPIRYVDANTNANKTEASIAAECDVISNTPAICGATKSGIRTKVVIGFAKRRLFRPSHLISIMRSAS